MAIKEISLTHEFVTIVDEADYDWLNQWKWHITNNGYAARGLWIDKRPKRKMIGIRMHRLIVNANPSQEVDHINGNRLDNRRCNLRIVTDAQNAYNAKKRKDGKYSQHKGVAKQYKNKWKARIQVNGKRYYLGYFDSEIEAAKAYNEAALKHFGEFARLNLI